VSNQSTQIKPREVLKDFRSKCLSRDTLSSHFDALPVEYRPSHPSRSRAPRSEESIGSGSNSVLIVRPSMWLWGRDCQASVRFATAGQNAEKTIPKGVRGEPSCP
jgi:hypothetical protein